MTEISSTTAPPQASNARLMRLATYASVTVALVLIGAKFWAWLATGSVSLLSTLIDSLLDAAASIINMVAVHHTLQPADKEHRFGHGKAEALAGLAQAAFISGSAMFLLIEAGQRLIQPRELENTEIGIWVMVISIALTLVLVGFQKYVIKKTGSVAIGADSLHYQADLLVNGSVIVSLLLVSQMGFVYADPLFALGIAAYIVWGAWQIGMQSLNMLMDRELPDEDRDKVRDITLAQDGVIDVHDMKTRSSGSQVFIQLHVEMDGNQTLRQSHDVAERVMFAVEKAFPNAEVLVHQDPEGIEERRETFD